MAEGSSYRIFTTNVESKLIQFLCHGKNIGNMHNVTVKGVTVHRILIFLVLKEMMFQIFYSSLSYFYILCQCLRDGKRASKEKIGCSFTTLIDVKCR